MSKQAYHFFIYKRSLTSLVYYHYTTSCNNLPASIHNLPNPVTTILFLNKNKITIQIKEFHLINNQQLT